MPNRMTWDEVRSQYPGQWVGFREPEYNQDNTLNSVLLVYTGMGRDDLFHLQINEDGLHSRYTTPDDNLVSVMDVGVAN